MKKTLWIAAALLTPAVAVFAQPSQPPLPPQPQPVPPNTQPPPPPDERNPFFRQPGQPGQPGPMDEERRRQNVEQMIERAIQQLGLSGDAAEKFKSVLREADQQRRKVEQELRDKLEQIRKQADEEMKKHLTAEQFQRYTEMMQRMGQALRNPGQDQGQPDMRDRLRRLGQDLQLSEEQQRQMQGLMRTLSEARGEMMKAAREGLSPDQLREQWAKIVSTVEEQAKGFLSAEQFKKFQELLKGIPGMHDPNAQPAQPEQPRPNQPDPSRRGGRLGFGNPEELLNRLGLDEKAREEFRQRITESTEKMRQAIREAMQQNLNPDELREKLRAIEHDIEKFAKERLSPEQFEQFKNFRERRNERRGQTPPPSQPPQQPKQPEKEKDRDF